VIAAQHATLVGDADRGGALTQAVHQSRGRLAPQDVLAAPANGADVVGAGVHGGDDPRDLLRRVLQVGVEGDHVGAARLREGGEDRQVLAGVPREQHHPGDVRTPLELAAQGVRGGGARGAGPGRGGRGAPPGPGPGPPWRGGGGGGGGGGAGGAGGGSRTVPRGAGAPALPRRPAGPPAPNVQEAGLRR